MRTKDFSGARAATLLVGIAIALAALTPSSAEAQRRPFYAGFGLGPYAFVDCPACRVHFRVQGEFGWHPSGDDTGFFLAVEAIPTFGDDFFMFMGGLRLGGDIEVYRNRNIGVLLRPSGLFGFGFRDWVGSPRRYGFFVLQPAFDLRLALASRVIQLWIRPVAFDFFFHPDYDARGFYFDAGYVFQVGLDFAF